MNIFNFIVSRSKILELFSKRTLFYFIFLGDTTVQSLTIQASIIGGRIVYEDSPLIKAIKEGSVAVIDEADKAPTNVTGILKSLIESGSMFLSDGRRVYPKDTGEISTIPSNMIIRTHPNFRMIVLANRPGFPFLGNECVYSLIHILLLY